MQRSQCNAWKQLIERKTWIESITVEIQCALNEIAVSKVICSNRKFTIIHTMKCLVDVPWFFSSRSEQTALAFTANFFYMCSEILLKNFVPVIMNIKSTQMCKTRQLNAMVGRFMLSECCLVIYRCVIEALKYRLLLVYCHYNYTNYDILNTVHH